MLNLNTNARKVTLSCEGIAFQKDGYGKKLEIIFADIIDFVKANPALDNRSLVKSASGFKLLEESIQQRFGLKLAFIPSNHGLMAVLPMILNKYHIFLNELLHGFDGIPSQETVLKGWDNEKGTVDTAKVVLGGVFAKYTHQLFINIYQLVHELDMGPSELTAILLHEIGHLFSNYEFSTRLESTNQVLAELSKQLKGEEFDKADYVYKNFLNLIGDTEDKDLITSGKTRVVIGMLVFRKYFNYVISQWPLSKYDETSSEQTADAFSTRFGYGRQLVNALDKIESKFGTQNNPVLMNRLNFVFNAMEVMIVLGFIAVPVLIPTLPVALVSALCMGMCIYGMGDNFRDMTYDELKVRYVRIREQYVNLLKNSDISKEESDKIITDIYAMDEVIASIKPFRSLFNIFSNFIFSSNRDVKNDVELQRLLEKFAHNDLFIEASKFKTI